MLSACSVIYADKFIACVQNVCLPNACMHRNVSCVGPYTSDQWRIWGGGDDATAHPLWSDREFLG